METSALTAARPAERPSSWPERARGRVRMLAGVVLCIAVLNMVGWFFALLGQWDEALRHCGEALTILCYGTMVHVVANTIEEMGVDAEIIDLRTLVPLDIEAIEASVKKTGRCLIVHEATRTSGFGAELSALVQEHCFYSLEAPIERVTGWDTPYPHVFEWEYFPGMQTLYYWNDGSERVHSVTVSLK